MTFERAFFLPVIAAVLATAAYVLPSPETQQRPPGRVAVAQVSYACPAGTGTTIAAGQLRRGTSVSATALPGRGKVAGLGGPSTWRTTKVDGATVIVEQRGIRSGPGGFYAGKALKADGGGLGIGSCPGILDDAWFLGVGSGAKHFSTLTLTNLAASTAVVDLDLWGPNGKIDAVDTRGIVIKPSSTRRIRLDSVAAGEAELALQVRRRRGSVSAVVNDTSRAVFRGTEPVSETLPPARDQFIGGLTSGTSGRTLEVLNPGGTTARVNVSVLGTKSEFKPAGLTGIKVRAGSLRLITVPNSAGADRQALHVTSDLPVAATVRMAPSNTDYAYAEAGPALSGPALVPVDVGGIVGAPDLILSAPHRQASATIQAYDARMRLLASKTVTIGSGTTQHLDTGKEFQSQSVAYLVVRPKGDVIGAATYVKGDGISSLALVAAPVTVLGPQVRPLG